MKYEPRNDLVLVERLDADDFSVSESGLMLPNNQSGQVLIRLKVLAIGSKVEDLQVGDIVQAESMFEKISVTGEKIGLVNEKYIHVIER